MAPVVYVLCALTSLLCAVLLLRTYRRTRIRLLLWSGLCFAFFAVNGVILFLDLVTYGASVDLSPLRRATTLGGVAILLYGLIWEARS